MVENFDLTNFKPEEVTTAEKPILKKEEVNAFLKKQNKEFFIRMQQNLFRFKISNVIMYDEDTIIIKDLTWTTPEKQIKKGNFALKPAKTGYFENYMNGVKGESYTFRSILHYLVVEKTTKIGKIK